MVYTPSKEEIVLISNVVAVGTQFKPLHQKLTDLFTAEVKAQIEKLKTEVFGVTQGDAGKVVLIAGGTNGTKCPNASGDHQMLWGEFVTYAFGVTSRRINQLLDDDRAKAERQAKMQTQEAAKAAKYAEAAAVTRQSVTPVIEERVSPMFALPQPAVAHSFDSKSFKESPIITPEERDREQLDMLVHRFDSIGKAVEQVVTQKKWAAYPEYAEVVDHAQKIAALVEGAGTNPHYDRKDPYLYFSQFKSEPQTLGDELAAMLIEFGLDLYQIKDVLRYAEKDAKLTLGKSEAVAA